MPDRDYSSRSPVEKLGIKAGHAVALESAAWPLDPALSAAVLLEAGRAVAAEEEPVDTALITVDNTTDAEALLRRWQGRLRLTGAIWLLSPKRGCPGYIDQRLLIDGGLAAGLVDNKVCSVSETVSAMRFVIRLRDRSRR
jgi:hypothetical protein